MANAMSRANTSNGVKENENSINGHQRWRIAHTKTEVANSPMMR